MSNFYSLYHPSVLEVIQAKRVFTEYVQEHAHEALYPPQNPLHNSKNIIIDCALSAVWMAGRRYEHNILKKNMEE